MSVIKYNDYQDWNIFPKMTFSLLQAGSCDNSVTGVCYFDKSLKKCIERCNNINQQYKKKGRLMCSKGYWISNGICVPLRNDSFNDMNPNYGLVSQNTYKEFKNSENLTSYVFINKKEYPVNQNQSNIIFYNDIMNLKHDIIDTLYNKVDNKVDDKVDNKVDNKIDDNSEFVINTTISILPFSISTFSVLNIPIKYNDFVIITVPGTNLILANVKNKLVWKMSTENFQENMKFLIKPINENINTEKFVTYDTPIYIESVYSNQLLHLQNNIVTINGSVNPNNEKTIFQLQPKMIGYYCDNNKIHTIPLIDCHIDKNNILDRYYIDDTNNKHSVSRIGLCFEKSNINFKNIKTYTNLNHMVILNFIILCILLFLLVRI